MLLDNFPYTTQGHSEEILNRFRNAASKTYFISDSIYMLKCLLESLILKIESQKSYFTLLLKKKGFRERVSKFMQKSIEGVFFR